VMWMICWSCNSHHNPVCSSRYTADGLARARYGVRPHPYPDRLNGPTNTGPRSAAQAAGNTPGGRVAWDSSAGGAWRTPNPHLQRGEQREVVFVSEEGEEIRTGMRGSTRDQQEFVEGSQGVLGVRNRDEGFRPRANSTQFL